MSKTLLLILLLPCYCIAQQGVAVSSADPVPAPTAILDVKSTSKGFLLPRMSALQRTSIGNPANGLMLLESDQQRLFQYRNGVWRYLLNSSNWIKSNGRNWMINVFDSVGIGTASLLEKLHIANGHFRINGAVKIDNGDVNLNTTGGTFQFMNASESKAFVQLSSTDLRLGTNAGNTSGQVRLATSGLTRVTVDNIGLQLNSTSRLTKAATGIYHMAAYCYGIVNEDGVIQSGTGNFQVLKSASGGATEYRITVEGIEAYTQEKSILLITPRISNVASYGAFQANNGYYVVKLWHYTSQSVEGGFNFVIYKQ